ncbi:EpsG family protein [Iodobacter sp. HSC-16F04]|uniref:EpsG family protein n=1 Tax=Iodobacter violaceini TaxID=3044271 RepID=A0ABX0KUY5_9NEIS|nr:EpsG family protein [Iodobacter violacea]NHQ85977.1 EpsG family protein [Iodobacter violacea]
MLWLFFVPFIYLCVLACLVNLDKKYTNFYLALIFLLLSFFAGLRSVDADYAVYADIFNEIPYINTFSLSTTTDIHGEIGFLFFGSIVKSLGLGFESFVFLCALVSVSLVVLSAKKLSYNPVLSLLFYFSHVFLLREMIQIRAALAVAIVLFSFSISISVWKRVVFILFSTLFHSGAIIIIPFYLLLRKTVFKWDVFLLIFGVSLLASNVGVAKPLIHLLTNVGLLPQAVANYVEWDLYNYHLSTFTNPVVWKAVIVLYFLRNFDRTQLGDSLYVIRNIYASGLIFMLLFSDFAIIAGRISTFLFFGEIMLISWAFLYKNRKFSAVLLVVLLSLMQLTLNLYVNESHQGYQLILLKG